MIDMALASDSGSIEVPVEVTDDHARMAVANGAFSGIPVTVTPTRLIGIGGG